MGIPASEVVHSSVKGMSKIERSEAQMRTALQSPAKLKSWLEQSGRQWIVLSGVDLVDALPWPAGVETFMQVLQCYRDHRSMIPTGDTETIAGTEVPVTKGELLELPEIDRAIRFLVGKATEKDPTWQLDNPPL